MDLDRPHPGPEPFFAPPIPPGGTAAAAHAFDWAATSLGPVEYWPQSLRTAADIVLGSNIPMMIAWGPDQLMVHNDSYGEILGDRRPALGQAARRNLGRQLGCDRRDRRARPCAARRSSWKRRRDFCGGRATETAWVTVCFQSRL
jgi:hypothetical protein